MREELRYSGTALAICYPNPCSLSTMIAIKLIVKKILIPTNSLQKQVVKSFHRATAERRDGSVI